MTTYRRKWDGLMSIFLKWALVVLGVMVISAMGAIGIIHLLGIIHRQNRIEQTQPVAQSQPAAQPSHAAQRQTVFDEHIRQSKIATCAGTFSALGREMSEGFFHTVRTQWDAKAGNEHAIQSLVALMPRPGMPTQQPDAGILFAAPVGSSCEGHLVRVTPVATTCRDIAAQLASSKGQNSPVGDLTVWTMLNGAQVMLLPFDKACVTVTVFRTAG